MTVESPLWDFIGLNVGKNNNLEWKQKKHQTHIGDDISSGCKDFGWFKKNGIGRSGDSQHK